MNSHIFLPSIFDQQQTNMASGTYWFLAFFVLLLFIGMGMYLFFMYKSGNIGSLFSDVGAEQIRAVKENK